MGADTSVSHVQPAGEPVLRVDGLDVTYTSDGVVLPVLRDVALHANPGEIVGIVGESGCGKSTLSAALMGLLPPNGRVTSGRAMFRGVDMFSLNAEARRRLRGSEISMVFQDPLTSLNPTLTIGAQFSDVLRAHRDGPVNRSSLRGRIVEMLQRVGLPDARARLNSYPHEFSGGQRQRIMIAMALVLKPALLIADEITSALDVTLEAQILQLVCDLRDDSQTAVLFVTHDLGVVAQVCDRVVVMYCGRTVEEGNVADIFDQPRHPYTRALLASVPSRKWRGGELPTIRGRVPSLDALPDGCAFANRCPDARAICHEQEPHSVAINTQLVRCHAHDPASGYGASREAATQFGRVSP